ncbi:MAG: phospholipid-binding protein [Desulfobacterales bacterium]|nr:phospholipid-binding protein [Desulfobacterales bacterium]
MYKFKWLVLFVCLVAFGFLFGCVSAKVSPNAVDLKVKFSWNKKSKCSNISPKIYVSNIPKGTKSLKVRLDDFNAPSWNHGGGTVPYKGSGVIKAGALTNGYNGPCPPSGSHSYQFKVHAIDKDGVIIGIGKAVRKFP